MLGWAMKRLEAAAHWFTPSDLRRLDQATLGDIARDIGVSVDDLRQLENKSAESADLIYRRLDSLGIDRHTLAARWPSIFKDLQRTCSLCESKGLCLQDFERLDSHESWRAYCPNASTLNDIQVSRTLTKRRRRTTGG